MAEFGLNQQFYEFMVEKFDEFRVEEHMQNLPLLQYVKQWIFDNIEDLDDWGSIVECPQFYYTPEFERFCDYDEDDDYDDEED